MSAWVMTTTERAWTCVAVLKARSSQRRAAPVRFAASVNNLLVSVLYSFSISQKILQDLQSTVHTAAVHHYLDLASPPTSPSLLAPLHIL